MDKAEEPIWNYWTDEDIYFFEVGRRKSDIYKTNKITFWCIKIIKA